MKKTKFDFKKLLRILDLVLVAGLLVVIFVTYSQFQNILNSLKSLSGDELTQEALLTIIDQFETDLGLFVVYILFLIATVVLSLKIIVDLYNHNRQGKYADEISKLVSQIDQDNSLESIKHTSNKLVNVIKEFSNTSYGTSKNVYASLYQLYTIKSMRAEADFEKMRAYTSILMKACVESLNLKNVYNDKKISMIADAAVMYDVGKLCVPGYILYKDGNLSVKDFEIAKYHTEAGFELMSAVKSSNRMGTYEQYVRDIAGYHHEKYNGGGYPYNKSGEDIPFIARVVAVISVYDTVTRDRPYKKAMTHEEAVLLINNEKGSTFDPNIVKLFNAVESQFKRIKEAKYL